MSASEHHQPDDWSKWSDSQFALEIQKPWVDLIVAGSKTIEVRQYPLPAALINKKLWILQSPSNSKQGVSSLGNVLQLNGISNHDNQGDSARPVIVGWMVISAVKEYTSKDSFQKDQNKHYVANDCVYSWSSSVTEEQGIPVFGWCIERVGVEELPDRCCVAVLIRRKRSLFELLPKE
ncbi:hypothetical protein ACA910_005042 [Epithemia clementina (nom. ined.)]